MASTVLTKRGSFGSMRPTSAISSTLASSSMPAKALGKRLAFFAPRLVGSRRACGRRVAASGWRGRPLQRGGDLGQAVAGGPAHQGRRGVHPGARAQPTCPHRAGLYTRTALSPTCSSRLNSARPARCSRRWSWKAWARPARCCRTRRAENARPPGCHAHRAHAPVAASWGTKRSGRSFSSPMPNSGWMWPSPPSTTTLLSQRR